MVGTTTRLSYTQDRQTERFWQDFEWNIQGVKRWPEDVEESITTIYLGRIIFHVGPVVEKETPTKGRRRVGDAISEAVERILTAENGMSRGMRWLTDWAWGIWLRLTRRCPKLS